MSKILVVDDEKQVRDMLRMVLERAGYEVFEAPDGAKALRVFQERPADLVIVDIVMPEREGFETIRELKLINPGVRLIAISGGGRVDPAIYLKCAAQIGAQHTFAKPIDHGRLLEAIEELLEDV